MRYAGGASSRKQVGPAAVHAREVHEHDHGQRQEADRDEAIGRPDQDRQRAQLGVVLSPRSAWLAVATRTTRQNSSDTRWAK